MTKVAWRWSLLGLVAGGMLASPSATEPTTIVARSAEIRIIDGGNVFQGRLVEGLDPDTYVYRPSPRPKQISMVTDSGRADFLVRPGDTVDFAVRRGGRVYNQRFAPDDPDLRYAGSAAAGGVDSIPFRLGPNNAIHLRGSINGSEPLNLIFDTGASTNVLTESGEAKGASVENGAVNRIDVGSATLAGARFTRIDYGGKLKADGVIGYTSLGRRVVEVDYDREVLRIHAQMPRRLPPGFRKVELGWREMAGMIPFLVHEGGRAHTVQAIFDTGSKWSLSLGKQDALAERLARLPAVGRRSARTADGTRVASRVITVPAVEIAGFRLAGVQADVETGSGPSGLPLNILGNDFLKQFNVFIDYRSGEVHLRPNHLRSAPYNRAVDYLRLAILAALVILVGGAAYWRFRRS